MHHAEASVLQVHKAVMTIEGVRRVVAVKVRHPGVADIIRRDFQVPLILLAILYTYIETNVSNMYDKYQNVC